MKYRELIERIERIEPNLAPHEVARFCLLLINSTDDLDTLADDSVLTAAWQEMSLRMQVATDQHEAMTEELEQLGNSDPQKFTQDQIWVLLRAIKVQSQIMDDQLRVTGKNRDDLQAVIANLKEKDFGIAMDFTNYR